MDVSKSEQHPYSKRADVSSILTVLVGTIIVAVTPVPRQIRPIFFLSIQVAGDQISTARSPKMSSWKRSRCRENLPELASHDARGQAITIVSSYPDLQSGMSDLTHWRLKVSDRAAS